MRSFLSILVAAEPRGVARSIGMPRGGRPGGLAPPSRLSRAFRQTVLAALLLALPGVASGAVVIPIVNADFELPVLPNDLDFIRISSGLVPGWSSDGLTAGVFNPATSSYPGEAPQGDNVGFVGSSATEITQQVSANLEANLAYTLTVLAGTRLDVAAGTCAIELRAGGAVLATEPCVNVFAGIFALQTLRYTAPAGHPNLGDPITIALRKTSGVQVNFDVVQLQAGGDVPGLGPVATGVLIAVAGWVGVRRLRARA